MARFVISEERSFGDNAHVLRASSSSVLNYHFFPHVPRRGSDRARLFEEKPTHGKRVTLVRAKGIRHMCDTHVALLFAFAVRRHQNRSVCAGNENFYVFRFVAAELENQSHVVRPKKFTKELNGYEHSC
jgi:hypothetical protein